MKSQEGAFSGQAGDVLETKFLDAYRQLKSRLMDRGRAINLVFALILMCLSAAPLSAEVSKAEQVAWVYLAGVCADDHLPQVMATIYRIAKKPFIIKGAQPFASKPGESKRELAERARQYSKEAWQKLRQQFADCAKIGFAQARHEELLGESS